LNQYKYFVWTNDDTSEENVLFAPTLDVAIEWFNNFYLEVHADGRSNVERIDLHDPDDEKILSYSTHTEVLNVS